MGFIDRVLALSQGVPELDRLVARAGNDLTVVSREGDRENILGMADETTSGNALVKIPQADGGVPGSRQGELTIRRQDDVLDKVVVSLQGTL